MKNQVENLGIIKAYQKRNTLYLFLKGRKEGAEYTFTGWRKGRCHHREGHPPSDSRLTSEIRAHGVGPTELTQVARDAPMGAGIPLDFLVLVHVEFYSSKPALWTGPRNKLPVIIIIHCYPACLPRNLGRLTGYFLPFGSSQLICKVG